MNARNSSILVTGGAGFIGSHFVRAARDRGDRVVVLDDLSTGSIQALPLDVPVIRADIAERETVRRVLREHEITTVVSFAGKIQISEAVARPELYFETNLVKTLRLLDVVREEGPSFIFSSTAAVYGESQLASIPEEAPSCPTNAYGMSKLGVEHALRAYGQAYGMRWAALRYFNAAGAHPSGSMREAHEPETHLIPLVIDAALGLRPPLTIYGDDYPTDDGTCIRDFVHVCDLADAHLNVLDALDAGTEVGVTNLGTGQGFSVRQVIEACSRVLSVQVPTMVGPRRAGDPPMLVANVDRARRILGWKARRPDLETIIDDAARSRR